MDADRMASLLQELLEGASEHAEDKTWVTTKEIAFSQGRADITFSNRRRLELLARQGLVEAKRVKRVNQLGREYSCLGYRLTEAGKEALGIDSLTDSCNKVQTL